MDSKSSTDVNLLCRLCGNHELVNMEIFGNAGKSRDLKEKIETCLPLEITEDDPLPKNVCYRCLLNVENFHEFYKKTIASTETLESLVHSKKSCIRKPKHEEISCSNSTISKCDKYTYVESQECESKSSSPTPKCDKSTLTEMAVLSMDQSTITDNFLFKDQYTLTDTIIKLNRCVGTSSDTISDTSDKDKIAISDLKPDVPDLTSSIITEISLRKSAKRQNNDVLESICTKKQKVNDSSSNVTSESEQNASRRKSKQPKKIENRDVVNNEVNCLLCGSEFESFDLLTKHLYDVHEIESNEIFDVNSSRNEDDRFSKKRIPNLVRITDALLSKSGSDSNNIKQETVSSDSEEEDYNTQQNSETVHYRQQAEAFREWSGNLMKKTVCNNNSSGFNNEWLGQNNKNNEERIHIPDGLDIIPECPETINNGIGLALWKERQYFADNTQHVLQKLAGTLGSHSCYLCARNFGDQASLWLHLRATHPQHAALACGICLKLCTSLQELRKHINEEHKKSSNSPRKFRCGICARQHDSKHKLLRHVKVHGFLVDKCTRDGKTFDPADYIENNFDDGFGENLHDDTQPILRSQLIKNERFEQDIEEITVTEEYDCDDMEIDHTDDTKYFPSFENSLLTTNNSVHRGGAPTAGTGTTARNYTLTYTCEWCERALPSKWARWQHVAATHVPVNPGLKCPLSHCGKVFVSETLRAEHEQHHQLQGAVPNSCEVCCKLWNTRVDFYKHMMGVHPAAVPLVCGVCLKIFPTVPHLYIHVQQSHLPLSGEFACNVCGRAYTNKSKMVRHRRIHGLTDGQLEMKLTMVSDNKDIEIKEMPLIGKVEDSAETTGSHECKECPGTKFTHFDEFSTHRRVLHQVFHCDLCTKYYGRNSHLWKHVNRCHKGNRLVTCQLCGKTSASKYHLQQHLSKIHALKPSSSENTQIRRELLEKEKKVVDNKTTVSNNLNVVSTEQPKEIDSSSDLYTSIITNYSPPPVNRGPHKCTKCGKGFHKRYLLKKHKKNCRPRLQENLLTRCKACERIFKDRQSLQKHLANYHSSFPCAICGVTYASKCEIISHVRFTHANHSSLVCECGNILRSPADLDLHKANHRASHVCQFCGDDLPSKIKLKMHVLSLHRKILALSCGLCLRLFASQRVLRDHVKLSHHRTNPPAANACAVCGKQYGSKWKCFDHINKSHGKVFRPCKVCLGVFETEDELKDHFRDVHLGVKEQRDIKNTSQIKPKIEPTCYETEMETKPLLSYISSEEYTDTKKLMIDETIRTSAKRTVYVNSNDPSTCEICLKTWPAKKHLWQHYIRCHKSVAATVCGICLKTNESYADLRSHLLEVHPALLHGRGFGSNFICKVCGRYHNASSKLRLHMAVHIGYESMNSEMEDPENEQVQEIEDVEIDPDQDSDDGDDAIDEAREELLLRELNARKLERKREKRKKRKHSVTDIYSTDSEQEVNQEEIEIVEELQGFDTDSIEGSKKYFETYIDCLNGARLFEYVCEDTNQNEEASNNDVTEASLSSLSSDSCSDSNSDSDTFSVDNNQIDEPEKYSEYPNHELKEELIEISNAEEYTFEMKEDVELENSYELEEDASEEVTEDVIVIGEVTENSNSNVVSVVYNGVEMEQEMLKNMLGCTAPDSDLGPDVSGEELAENEIETAIESIL